MPHTTGDERLDREISPGGIIMSDTCGVFRAANHRPQPVDSKGEDAEEVPEPPDDKVILLAFPGAPLRGGAPSLSDLRSADLFPDVIPDEVLDGFKVTIL